MIIAEIGTSHGTSIQKAKKLINIAKEAGADAVKFQWVYADELLHPKSGNVPLYQKEVPLYERFQSLECPFSFYEECKNYAHKKNMLFICSPFGLKSLRELIQLKPDAIKIASPELNHFPMLEALQDYRTVQKALGYEIVPVILSSGVSNLSDIENALSILGKENVTLLHCSTSYPTPEEEYNVSLIENYEKIFGIPCGISDHSLDPVLVPALSIAFGSVTIEKHITVSKKTNGLDDPVSLTKEQFFQMTNAIHQAEAAILRYGKTKGRAHIIKEMSNQYGRKKVKEVIGDGVKKLSHSEAENYEKTNRSLHYTRDLKKGSIINENDIAVLRTEKVLTVGISPSYYHLLQSCKLTHNVKSGDGVKLEDFLQKIIS